MNVLFVQLPVPAFIAGPVTGNTPLAAGTLIMHARHRGIPTAADCSILPIAPSSRSGDALLVAEITRRNPEVVCFTCAVWNIERTRSIALQLRKCVPAVRIWIGGPEVSVDSPVVRRGDFFDVGVEGEGEEAFSLLLKGHDPHEIAGLLLPGGVSTNGSIRPGTIADLTSVHDPYIAGLVVPEADGVVLAEFSRGCKYGCLYCRYHQGRTGQNCNRQLSDIAKLLSWCRASGARELYLLDPSLEQRSDFASFLAFLAEHNPKPVVPLFAELRIDLLDAASVKLLYDAGVRTVEAGLQTITSQALKKAGRKVDLEKFAKSAKALAACGIDVCIDIMTGLPGDTPEGLLETIDFLQEHDCAGHVQVFRTQVFPGTGLRRIAEKSGVRFEALPPYQILETPTWTNESLEMAIDVAEEELGTSNNPEERPLIPSLRVLSTAGEHIEAFDDCAAVFFYGYDLAIGRGRDLLARQNFVSASNTMALWIKNVDPARDGTVVLESVERCIAVSPYSSLCVMLGITPFMALDILDDIDELLGKNLPTRYLQRLFPTTYTERPERRLFAALPAVKATRAATAWLEDVREIAEIIWTADCTSVDEALHLAQTFEIAPEDFLFLDVPFLQSAAPADRESFFTRLVTSARYPDLLLLPAPDLHWQFIRFLETPAKR